MIVNAKRLFSNDLTYANLMRFTLLFMAPKLANLLGIRINAQSVDYFNVFSTKIIADKRKSYLKGGGHGKASNFIELMLEAEAEEGGGNFTDALQGEEKEKLKCKFLVLKWEVQIDKFLTQNFFYSDMTNEEIIAHCILFFIAGYDTTASVNDPELPKLPKNTHQKNHLFFTLDHYPRGPQPRSEPRYSGETPPGDHPGARQNGRRGPSGRPRRQRRPNRAGHR